MNISLSIPLLSALLLAHPVFATETGKNTTAPAHANAGSQPPCPPPPHGKTPPPPRDGTTQRPPGNDEDRPAGPPPDRGNAPPPCPPTERRSASSDRDSGASGRSPAPPPGGSRPYTLSAAYRVSEALAQTGHASRYASDKPDESALWVSGGGRLELHAPQIVKQGDSSSHENSSFYGLNAALLVTAGGRINVRGGHLSASGLGANAVSVIDNGSVAELDGSTIQAHGNGAHGVDAANGGSIVLRRVTIETFDASAAAVATDRGGGRIIVEGGRLLAHGYRSPGLYSTGTISVTGAQVHASGAEAAVIEGSNTIEVRDSALRADKSWGAMLYQSFSGDAQGRHGRYSQHGGSFGAAEGPLFYVTNTTGEIVLENVRLQPTSGVLLKASDGQWGNAGDNGGQAVLQARRQYLPGDLLADHGGSIRASLTDGSVLEGRVDGVALSLDRSSRWVLRGDSRITTLTVTGGDPGSDAAARLAGIRGNGHSIVYDAKLPANAWLGGKRWALTGGGSLQPGS